MHTAFKYALAFAVILLLTITIRTGCRQALQPRAVYPGGLTFVGENTGLFGRRYNRVFLWREADDTSPLPAVYVQIEEQVHALDALTPELFLELGGTRDEGSLFDAQGAILRYRFTRGRLTWLSLDAGRGSVSGGVGGNVRAGQFRLSRDGNEGLTLPVDSNSLRTRLGAPDDESLYFPQ